MSTHQIGKPLKTWPKMVFNTGKMIPRVELPNRQKGVELYIDFYLKGVSWAVSHADPDFTHTYSFNPVWTQVNSKQVLVIQIFETKKLKSGGHPGNGGNGVVPPPPVPQPPM